MDFLCVKIQINTFLNRKKLYYLKKTNKALVFRKKNIDKVTNLKSSNGT